MPRPTLTALLFAVVLLAGPALAQAATGSMRLPEGVKPLAYQLSLTVDPAQPTHSGEVGIELQIDQPTRTLQLHAKELQVRQAWIETGSRRHTASQRRFDGERIELRFAQALPAGRARLGLVFSGRQQDTEEYGLFRRREASDWYAYTQFESTGARLAFPLLDEPGWKVPWQLTLTVPQAASAFANTAIKREEPATPGWKRIEFETTPPLPSYLLAWAVGPFDVLDAPPAGPVPVRFLTPRGRAAEAAFAAGITHRIVERLEAYFDLPHPYPKLDSVAMAIPADFGAMEHAGLITYAAPLLLAAPGEATPRFQRNQFSLAAHELAHQWFGNLVTMRWWDDLWLNESFASWLGDRVTDELMPQWHWSLGLQQARSQAMHTDRLASSRRIQQPVLTDDDLAGVWDSITYQKGQVVLAMFEQWLGPERFREGVRRYIHRHAWGHASGDDFLAALATQDPTLPAALRSFTSQPGIPRVRVVLECADGVPPALRLTQSRLLALPAATAGPTPLWQVPLRIRTPAGLTRHLLAGAEDRVPLPDSQCPAWVQANAGGQGYYRVAYEPAHWRALMRQPGLPAAELLAGLDDAVGLSEAGDLPLAEMLAMAEHLARHEQRQVVEQAAQALRRARQLLADPDAPEETARWQRAFGEQARALGWAPAEGTAPEDEDTRLLRALLVPLVAEHGADGGLRAEARRRVQAWLAGGPVPDAALRGALLASAAIEGDEALFDSLLRAARRSTERGLRGELYGALGHFRAPRLAQRARELLLDPGIDFREAARPLMQAQNEQPRLREGLLQFLQARHAALAGRMGRDEPAWLPLRVNLACSVDEAQRIERFFGPLAGRYQGGPRALAQTLERVRICSAWREREAARRAAAPGPAPAAAPPRVS